MNKLNKKNIIILIIISIIILCLILYYMHIKNEEEFISCNTEIEENIINETNGEEKKNKNQEIIVHITGSVINQGIVKLEENSRVSDAIEAAGGTKEDADLSKINLAFVLEDGMKIYIPNYNDEQNNGENKIQETISQNSNGNKDQNQNSNIKININTANQTELEKLPGVGVSTAKKIISYRNENGKFKKVEDIKNVKGIGTSKFEQIKEFIYIK